MPEVLWGQASGPAAGLPPGAGEGKIFGQRREPSLDRVPFDVVFHALAFCIVADQVVVGFVLPERAFVQSEHADGFVSREALERAEPFSRRHVRGHEKVHVIRHDHERMHFVAAESVFAVRQRPNHHLCYLGPLEEHGAAFGVIQQAIHSYERFACHEVGRPEDTGVRKASVQPERHEDSFAHDIKMWEAAFVPTHVGCSAAEGGSSRGICAGRKPDGRAEAPPHQEPDERI
jgi:hypothetical protein